MILALKFFDTSNYSLITPRTYIKQCSVVSNTFSWTPDLDFFYEMQHISVRKKESLDTKQIEYVWTNIYYLNKIELKL